MKAIMRIFLFGACLLMAAGLGLTFAQSREASPDGPIDAAFLQEAYLDGMAGIALGKIAGEQGGIGDVKSYGARVAEDHRRLNEEITALAKKKGIALPRTLDPKRQNAVNYMAGLTIAALDREYMSLAQDDQEKLLSDFRRQAAFGRDPEIRAFAAGNVSLVQENYRRATEILRNIPAPFLK